MKHKAISLYRAKQWSDITNEAKISLDKNKIDYVIKNVTSEEWGGIWGGIYIVSDTLTHSAGGIMGVVMDNINASSKVVSITTHAESVLSSGTIKYTILVMSVLFDAINYSTYVKDTDDILYRKNAVKYDIYIIDNYDITYDEAIDALDEIINYYKSFIRYTDINIKKMIRGLKRRKPILESMR